MPSLKVICMQDSRWESATGCHKYHDAEAWDTVISYCLQEQKTYSSMVGGFGINLNQASYEMMRLAEAFGKAKGLHLRHMILTFSQPEVDWFGTDALGEIYKIATYAARYYANQYQIIYAVHEDTDNYHVHFVMNTVSFVTGKKYRGDKADYYSFQKYLSDFLDEYYGMNLHVFSDKNSHYRKISN